MGIENHPWQELPEKLANDGAEYVMSNPVPAREGAEPAREDGFLEAPAGRDPVAH